MKNLILFFAIILVGSSAFGQGFSIGYNMGAPVADGHNFYSFTLGIDANHTWAVSNKFLVGIATGFNFFLGNELKIGGGYFFPGSSTSLKNASFIPIAFATRLDISDKIMLGADVGYAVGVSHDGGFYYRPILGYNFKIPLQISLSYRGISIDGFSVDAVTVDINYTFSRRIQKMD